MSDELMYQVALELIPGVGKRGVKHLFSYCGSAHEVFQTPKHKLLKIPGVGSKLADLIHRSRHFSEAEKIIESARTINAQILHFTHPEFPQRLKQIPDSPNIIYVKGNGDLNPKRSVAVVGTRKATPYGKEMTDRIIAELSTLDVTVISGLAYGIDIQAHKACLKENLSTFAVLAGGLDRIYPSQHKKFVDQILNSGGIISESIPGTKPDPHLFPARNRIIAGLADATIVVEAAEKGGALITANLADSYDRAVFAIPGDIGNTYSEGTNRLIASQRALIYTSVVDLLYHLNWDVKSSVQKKQEVPDLNKEEKLIYDLLVAQPEPMHIDLIAIKSQISINQIASILLNLEFMNLVRSLPGKKFTIIHP